MKCEKCNGEIIEGKLLSLQGIFFILMMRKRNLILNEV